MNRTMGLSASVVRYAAGVVLERHAHGAASVSVVLAGSIEEEVGRATAVGRIGSVVAKPAWVEHRNRVGRDGAVLLAITGADAVAPAWRWTQPPGAAAAGLQLARSLRSGAAIDRDRLLDLVASAGPDENIRSSGLWLDDIRARIDRDPNPPSVRELAAEAEVHPVYLARAFRRRFGCSLREYRRQRRVRCAARLLASSNLPIAVIAAQLDFFDQSHLCRDFRAELAISPREYRAILRS
jgi:AraC family transcriptional regulator